MLCQAAKFDYLCDLSQSSPPTQWTALLFRLVASEAVLRIPEEQHPHLLMLAGLAEPAFRALVEAVANAPMKFRAEQLVATIRPSADLLSKVQIEQAIMLVRDLAFVRAMAEVELPEFVSDVNDALTVALAEQLGDVDRARLSKRLEELLQQPSILSPAKARSLLTDHANTLCRARIFSDIRPVFGADVSQNPSTAFVVHTLKLSYHQGAEAIKDFFVVLDRNDLDILSELLERAKAKEKTLHVTMQAAGLDPLLTD
jgi:hypothetical protein